MVLSGNCQGKIREFRFTNSVATLKDFVYYCLFKMAGDTTFLYYSICKLFNENEMFYGIYIKFSILRL